MISLSRLLKLTRWYEWYDSKVPMFFVCMYFSALTQPEPVTQTIYEIFTLTLILCIYAGFGNIINSYYDRFIDRAAEKENMLADLSDNNVKLVLLLTYFISLLSILFFYRQSGVMTLIALTFLTAYLYSAPPVRFKERGFLGLIIPALAQRTLPSIIIFQAMGAWDITALLLCLLGTLIGLRYMIVHQITDYQADLESGVKTFTTERGTGYSRMILNKILFPMEILSLAAVIVMISTTHVVVGILFTAYLAWFLILRSYLLQEQPGRYSVISFYILSDFYYLYWPVILSALLVSMNPYFWIIFIFNLIWLRKTIDHEFRNIKYSLNVLKNRYS